MTFKAPTTPEIGGAGRVLPFRNLCRLCHFKICTGLAQTKIQKSVQISDLHSATQSAQQKPLILLGEMHFCANLSYISLVGLKNIKTRKNSVENFKSRARRRVHTRHLLPRARARYSIGRISRGEPTGRASVDINRADPKPGTIGFPDPKASAPIG